MTMGQSSTPLGRCSMHTVALHSRLHSQFRCAFRYASAWCTELTVHRPFSLCSARFQVEQLRNWPMGCQPASQSVLLLHLYSVPGFLDFLGLVPHGDMGARIPTTSMSSILTAAHKPTSNLHPSMQPSVRLSRVLKLLRPR